MENITLPSKIEFSSGGQPHSADISIQPCHPGYGVTLGNALRRVLLSSLPGAAVTSFRLKGAAHEFSAVPGVKEDGVEVSLNLKQLRFKLHGDEPVKVTIAVKGQKNVTGKDIKTTSAVEVVNTDCHIATLTSKDAEFEMELIVGPGRGYVPVEEMNKEGLEIGMIPIDAIYTPVKNVAFKVDNVRVGDITNYENLVLHIETDGTIEPKHALEQATEILINHFNFIAETAETAAAGKKAKKAEVQEPADESTPEAEIEAVSDAEAPTEDKPKKKRGRPKKSEAKEE